MSMTEEGMEESVEDSLSTVSVEVPFLEEQSEQRSIIQMAPPAAPSSLEDNKGKGKKKRRHCTVENCHYSTPYSKDLARHMRKHTGEKPYACDRCSKSYSRYDKLVIHIRVHEGYRPFKCNSCEYAAVDSGALAKHQRTHSNERPYKCQLCPYAAKDSSQLVVHLRSHTQDNPYFCMEDECDAAFKTLSDLQRHARTHTGEKPYACSHCSYRAAVKSNLNAHLKKHHLKGNAIPQPPPPAPTVPTDQLTLVVSSGDTRDDISGATCIQYASDNGVELEDTGDSFPSTEVEESVILLNETGVEITVPPFKLDSVTPNKKSSRSSRSEETCSSTSLPFQYACKQCPYKADTLKLFAVHMKKVHEDAEGSLQLLRSKCGGGKVGRPRPPRRTKGSHTPCSGTELERFYDCSVCAASFVREDSLRCHMRQHSDSSISIPKPKLQPQRNDENGESTIYSFPTFCYEPSSSRSDELTATTPESQDPNLPLEMPSVITENPGVITSSVPSPHHLYIISPGGSTIQSIERGDFIIH